MCVAEGRGRERWAGRSGGWGGGRGRKRWGRGRKRWVGRRWGRGGGVGGGGRQYLEEEVAVERKRIPIFPFLLLPPPLITLIC